MKLSTLLGLGLSAALLATLPAHAQDADDAATTDATTLAPTNDQMSDKTDAAQAAPEEPRPAVDAAAQAPAPAAEAPRTSTAETSKPSVGGDLRAPSPGVMDQNRRGYFSAGIGPAYGIGFESDSLLYNIQASYNLNYNDRITGKGIVDVFMGTGSVSSRLINIGFAADIFAPEINPFASGLPYFNAEVALGNGRNALEETATGVTIGGGAGFRFQAQDLNWDVSANYALLTAPVGNTLPSVIGARVALTF